MELQYASTKELQMGWLLSTSMLKEIQLLMESVGYHLDLEEIEALLIFYKKYSMNGEK